MNLLDPISKIMTTELITLNPTNSISDAANIFKKHRIHHIPIVDNGELQGIVSKSDFSFFKRGFLDHSSDNKIEEMRMNNYEVKYIMTSKLAKMEPTEKINVAIEIFKENILHAIPIVENGKLVGIVTTHDIITLLAEDNEAHAKYELS